MEESLIGMGVTIVVLTFWLALVAVYLAPSLIVWRKQLPATPWFVAVNVLAGWLDDCCVVHSAHRSSALPPIENRSEFIVRTSVSAVPAHLLTLC